LVCNVGVFIFNFIHHKGSMYVELVCSIHSSIGQGLLIIPSPLQIGLFISHVHTASRPETYFLVIFFCICIHCIFSESCVVFGALWCMELDDDDECEHSVSTQFESAQCDELSRLTAYI